jgi:hypothetical protein
MLLFLQVLILILFEAAKDELFYLIRYNISVPLIFLAELGMGGTLTIFFNGLPGNTLYSPLIDLEKVLLMR